jgi:hypothetical protein
MQTNGVAAITNGVSSKQLKQQPKQQSTNNKDKVASTKASQKNTAAGAGKPHEYTVTVGGAVYVTDDTISDGNCGVDSCKRLLIQAGELPSSAENGRPTLGELRKRTVSIVTSAMQLSKLVGSMPSSRATLREELSRSGTVLPPDEQVCSREECLALVGDNPRLDYQEFEQTLERKKNLGKEVTFGDVLDCMDDRKILGNPQKIMLPKIASTLSQIFNSKQAVKSCILVNLEGRVNRRTLNSLMAQIGTEQTWEDIVTALYDRLGTRTFASLMLNLGEVDSYHIFNAHQVNSLNGANGYINKVSNQKSSWFTNIELALLLRSFGICYTGIRNCSDGGIVLAFSHTSGREFLLYSNARMAGHIESSSGSHWQSLTPNQEGESNTQYFATTPVATPAATPAKAATPSKAVMSTKTAMSTNNKNSEGKNSDSSAGSRKSAGSKKISEISTANIEMNNNRKQQPNHLKEEAVKTNHSIENNTHNIIANQNDNLNRYANQNDAARMRKSLDALPTDAHHFVYRINASNILPSIMVNPRAILVGKQYHNNKEFQLWLMNYFVAMINHKAQLAGISNRLVTKKVAATSPDSQQVVVKPTTTNTGFSITIGTSAISEEFTQILEMGLTMLHQMLNALLENTESLHSDNVTTGITASNILRKQQQDLPIAGSNNAIAYNNMMASPPKNSKQRHNNQQLNKELHPKILGNSIAAKQMPLEKQPSDALLLTKLFKRSKITISHQQLSPKELAKFIAGEMKTDPDIFFEPAELKERFLMMIRTLFPDIASGETNNNNDENDTGEDISSVAATTATAR